MSNDFLSGAKRFGIDLEKFGLKPKSADVENEKNTESKNDKLFENKEYEKETASSLNKELLGTIGTLEHFYFPVDLIGGCCPRIIGEEQQIVWNAAAEAADSERVHVVWQSQGDKIWYVAVRSAELGSHPNTWCPFAAMLPGMKDAAIPPAIYTYFSDEAATMMTITNDGLQLHRGMSSVVRAKAERTSRELDNAPVLEIVPDMIERLIPVPWFSLSLFEDRARRILAAASVFAALSVAAIAFLVWCLVSVAVLSSSIEKDEIQKRTEDKTVKLMSSVQNTRASPMREQLAKFADLNDGLLTINGLLEVYQIREGKLLWRAVVPANVTSDRINELGGQTLETNPQGVTVGNSREALTFSSNRK